MRKIATTATDGADTTEWRWW